MALKYRMEQRFETAAAILAGPGGRMFTRRDLQGEINRRAKKDAEEDAALVLELRKTGMDYGTIARKLGIGENMERPFASRTFNRYVKEYRRARILRAVRTRQHASGMGRPSVLYRLDMKKLASRMSARLSEETYRTKILVNVAREALFVFPLGGRDRFGLSVAAIISDNPFGESERQLRRRIAGVRETLTESTVAVCARSLAPVGEMIVIGPRWHPNGRARAQRTRPSGTRGSPKVGPISASRPADESRPASRRL